MTLDLLAGASVDVISNGANYTFTLSGTDTWSGTDSANVTGNGTNTLTVTSAGIAAFTDINIMDSGDTASVNFNNSGVNTFSENITVTLDNTGAAVYLNGDVTTSGTLSITGATTVSADTVITSSGGGDVIFNSTLDGSYNLTVNTVGTTSFNDKIGSSTRLGGLTTNAGGDTNFNITSAVNVVDIQGAVFFGDDVMIAGGGQIWYLRGDTTFDGNLDGNVDIIFNMTEKMTFNGSVSFKGLQILNPNPVYINGGSVTTTTFGINFYADVVLGEDTNISSGDQIRFRGTINGAYALRLNAPGTTTFEDSVGDTTPLTRLTTDADGTTVIEGGTFNLSGNILMFNDPVTLSVNTVITDAGAVDFENTIDGSYTLSIDAGGIVSFYGKVGSTTPLTGLTVTADVIAIADSINVGTHIVTMAPRTVGYPISLGAEILGSLSLTDAEMDQITAGTLRVGSSSAGSVTFNSDISPAGASTLSLITGDEILDLNPGTDVVGTNLAIQAVNGIANNELLETEVSTIAALNTTSGSIAILETYAGGSLIVGTVDGVVGLRNEGYTGVSYLYNIQLETTNGDLTVNNDIYNQRRNIYLMAQEGNGGNGDSLFTNNANIVTADDGLNSANAIVYVVANNMILAPSSTISANNQVVLEDDPSSIATVEIVLGGTDGLNRLGLTDAELDTVTTAKLQIGHNNSGDLDIVTSIDLTDGPNIPTTELRSGRAILDGTFSIFTANSLNMIAGTNIGVDSRPFAMDASTLTTSGVGDQYLFEENSVSVGSFDLNAGSGNTIQLDDGIFVTNDGGNDIQNNTRVMSGSTLKGTGTVYGSATVQSGGALAPGSEIGILSAGDTSFATGSDFNVEINGSTTAGTDYDQLGVTGTVVLNDANLILSGAPSGTSNGDEMTLINNDGVDAVSGTFSSLAEGAVISDFAGSSYDAQISYQGGDGNDVTLTVLHPEIDVQRPAGTTIADEGTDAQDSLQPVVKTLTYTVANTGAAPLDVTNITTANLNNVTVNSISPTSFTVASGSTSTFDVQFTPTLDGAFSFELDIVSNDTDEGNYDITVSGASDGTGPGVTIEQGSSQADPTNTSPIVFDVTFSENVTGFDDSDVTVTGMSGTPGITVTSTGTGDTYTVEVTGAADGETIMATISANAAQDSTGNFNVDSTSTDNSVTYDLSSPTVTIEQGSSQADPTNTSPIVFDVTFSEVVTGFDNADVTITGMAAVPGITVTSTGAGDTYTVAVTGMVDGETITAAISANAAQDSASNFNVASTSADNSVTYDVSVIEIISNGIVSQNGDILKNNGIYIAQFSSLEITFSSDANDPVGSSDPDDVTNPANYLLIQPGLDNLYSTTSCLDVSNNGGAVFGDDVKIKTGPVTYDAATFTATVSLNNGVLLPYGEYRLFLCGTTSITDLAGNALNDGIDTVLTFIIEQPEGLPETGFIPGERTSLSAQPVDKAYNLTDMALEIPKLDVFMPIVGVPFVDDEWDVSWLGNRAGYLYGSAFPTWAGNTVITGHVWDANNQPGPFSELKSLQYGDRIQIQSGGQVYTYEVRESRLVTTKDMSVVLQSEDYDWVTLVTCEFYDEANGEYLYRRIVRAVLISVE